MNIKNKLIQYLTRRLLKAVNDEDILTISSDGYLLRKRNLTQGEVQNLKDEAQSILDSELWNLMKAEVEYMAFLRMTAQAQRPEDIVFGKAMFYNLDQIEKFLKNLSR